MTSLPAPRLIEMIRLTDFFICDTLAMELNIVGEELNAKDATKFLDYAIKECGVDRLKVQTM